MEALLSIEDLARSARSFWLYISINLGDLDVLRLK